MKKIRLNVLNLGATEILTREQLKSVFGGATGSGSGSGSGSTATCTDYSCGAKNLPCCASSDYCSGPYSTSTCIKRPQ